MVQLSLSDISPFLTEAVLNKAFKVKTNSDDSIRSLAITRATPVGEGLISSVYRIRVKGATHEASFVAKSTIRDKLLKRTLKCERLFQREAMFFTKLLPALTKNQISLGAKERIQDSVPRCYMCYCDGDDDFILLEDLAEKGCDKKSNPTKHQGYMALKTLAHFHSVSIALRETDFDLFNELVNDIDEVYYINDNKEWYSTFLSNSLEIDKQALVLHEDPETSGYYKKFVETTSGDVYGEMIRLTSTMRSKNRVVLHGDSWLQNFLISDKSAVAVDFQILRCSSPAKDLVFFSLLCSSFCQSKTTFEKAVRVYYDALEYYLKDMGIDANAIFSWDRLWQEIRKYGRLGFLQILTTIPLTSDPEFCDNLDDFSVKYKDVDRIPLEDLWRLRPLASKEEQMRFVNALRVAVDVGII